MHTKPRVKCYEQRIKWRWRVERRRTPFVGAKQLTLFVCKKNVGKWYMNIVNKVIQYEIDQIWY